MYRRVLLVFAALSLTCAWAVASPESDVERVMTSEAARYHACIVAASIDGAQTRTYIAGKTLDGKRCDDRALFEIGSVTKVLTGFVLAHDVAAGRAHLDDSVASYLPGWSIPRGGGRAMTLLDLATHTSGLPRDSKVDDEDGDPDATYSALDMQHEIEALRLKHSPGTNYEYSNLGSGLLGYALARRDGVALERSIRDIVLAPLQMNDTVANLAGYRAANQLAGTTSDGQRATIWHATAANLGASGYLSNLHDMLLFLHGVMNAHCLGGLCALAQAPRRDSDDGQTGLFWEIANGQIWKDGETDGYASFVGMTQDRRCGFVILANTGRDQISDIGYKTFLPECARR